MQGKVVETHQKEKANGKAEKPIEAPSTTATRTMAGWLSRSPSGSSVKTISSTHSAGKDSDKGDTASVSHWSVFSPASSAAVTPAQSPGEGGLLLGFYI